MTSRGVKYWTSGAVPLIAPEKLADIITAASDIAMMVSDTGKVLSVLVNPNHASFGRLEHWEGRDIRDFLTRESIPKFEERMDAIATGEENLRAVELNHSDGVNWDFPVRYTFHEIGPDGALLLLGRDLRQIAEMQQQLVQAQLALERDYEAQREFDTRYRVLMDNARDAVIFVTVANGRVADLNNAAAQLLGGSRDDVTGLSLAQVFEPRGTGDDAEDVSAAVLAQESLPAELQARNSQRRLTVSPRLFRAAGERFLLLRLEPADEAHSATDALSEDLAALFREGVDAILFTDASGTITAANEAFLDLSDSASEGQVKGRSLAEFLSRGSVDMKVLTENAARAGHMRLYATRLVRAHGSEVAVEISAAYLADRANPAIAFVLRDASRIDALRKPGATVSEDGMQNVMELVGSATLKDIVAETTDVVEKMCIETAVELTNNNRVAAAEMLGLSRQSLYVKLRKYGLLNRDGD